MRNGNHELYCSSNVDRYGKAIKILVSWIKDYVVSWAQRAEDTVRQMILFLAVYVTLKEWTNVKESPAITSEILIREQTRPLGRRTYQAASTDKWLLVNLTRKLINIFLVCSVIEDHISKAKNIAHRWRVLRKWSRVLHWRGRIFCINGRK